MPLIVHSVLPPKPKSSSQPLPISPPLLQSAVVFLNITVPLPERQLHKWMWEEEEKQVNGD